MSERLTPDQLSALQARRHQARANNAIEGVILTPSQNALFEQFDAEALPHEERRRRLILRLTAGPLVPAE